MSINLLSIVHSDEQVKRIKQICDEFEYVFKIFSSVDDFADQSDELGTPQSVVLSATQVEKQEDIAGMVQVVKQLLPDSFVVTIIGKKMSANNAAFIKKSGCDLVMLENEFVESTKLEYVLSQIIRSSLIPVKAAEFEKDTVLDFTLYYLMPMNKKLIPLIPKGTSLDEARLKKINVAGELLIKRTDVAEYKKYISKYLNQSAKALLTRCRAQYLHFCKSHFDLVSLLSDQSEGASFEKGKELYERCENLASELLATLAMVEDPFEVVNSSNIGGFGSLERSPAVAAFAGVLSLKSGLGEPKEVMTAALIVDIGMLDMTPQIMQKIRKDNSIKSLNAEELKLYHQHPAMSLNKCLSRKIQIKDSIRNMILCSHERMDGKGFPQATFPDKISVEAMLIQFADMIDQMCLVKWGEQKISAKEAMDKTIEENITNKGAFTFDFISKMKSI